MVHDQLNLDIPITFDLQGAKLTALTQAIAYRGIMERQPPRSRETTEDNLQITREALHTLRTRVKQFLYKAMHGTQKIGSYWQHILILCRATPCNLIWSLAKDLWPHAQHLWPETTLGIILGCGAITLPALEHRENLLQILMSEAAHLIWVMRCERVIRDPPHIHLKTR
jgi:hypothetical protein